MNLVVAVAWVEGGATVRAVGQDGTIYTLMPHPRLRGHALLRVGTGPTARLYELSLRVGNRRIVREFRARNLPVTGWQEVPVEPAP